MSNALPPPSSEDLKSMPITAHLIELRAHLVRIFVAVIGIFVVLAYFARDLYQILSEPLQQHLPANATMIATDVTTTFMSPIKLTLYVAFFIAMPYILHQIWQFIAPALYKNEKRIAIPILLSSIVLFYLGIAFAYFLALPNVLKFFMMFSPENVVPMTDIDSYLTFALKLFLVFGLTFEVPIATLLLILARVVTVDSLVDKRRYIIVGCFAVSAVVTPPDGLSMLMLAIPMWLLFEFGLLLGRLVEPKPSAEAVDAREGD
ncbi:MAG: twin-arginine translocase subunit TatC [Pseudomonadota bacterium]|nr:twin-arginine translocase subunit TatC [Pseudomonadota bacterium]